jgi:ABC-type polysaccharide/polyol phosphate transport system ATPase subunit
MRAIVECERLGKQYQIRHQRERQSYVALRDVLAAAFTAPFRRAGRAAAPPAREAFWALRDVSFEMAAGEVLGIIGRNGAGKSTLLKVLSRITEPTEGRLVLRGRVASLLEVGTGFHPELTGRENIFLNGAILGMTRAEIVRKFDEIVAFAEVERFLDTPVKRYSSGMYVRLAFAVAAHLEPEILVVDEVLAVGDAEFQKKCLGKMRDVSRGGRTVLFVSHNMAAIQALCGRAIWLEHGAIAFDGPVDAAVARYLKAALGGRSGQTTAGVRFGPALTLDAFSITPNPIDSGGRLEFALTIVASESTRLEQLTVLFYSFEETRIGIVDLRRAGLPRSFSAGDSWTVTGTVAQLPLVEGSYRVGLGVADTASFGNNLDLVELRVTPKEADGDIVPYPAAYRGVVELDYAVSAS